MLFDLGALWLIVWLCKNAAMDVMYASSGKPNPRWELKKAKARAAGLPGPAQHSFGGRDWLADLVSDGLQAQTDWRRRKADAKRRARLEQHEAEQARKFADAVDAQAEAEAEKAERARQADLAGQVHELDPEPQPDPANPPQTSGPDAGGAPGSEQSPQSPRPTEAPDERPWAKVIPFRTTDQQEETVSTDINTEVQGLDQSIAYAHSLATFAGEHGEAGNEGYIAHLTGAKVEGDGLSTAAEMQEAFTNAQTAAEAHAAELEKQKAVQEAYDATPDAGDKAFQTEGR